VSLLKQARRPKRQAGTVLVMAILIVAIITGIAVSFTGGFQLSLARAEQRFYTGQLKHYWLSMENFVLWGLKEDAKQDQEDHGGLNDHLKELWSTLEIAAPFEAGQAVGQLEDAQSRFNLNQLRGRANPYNANGSFAERFTETQQRFVRLLQTYPDAIIDTAEAEQITEALMDWVDADSDEIGLGGAENNYYASLEPAYRAANQPFASVSELRLVKGVSKELYEYLLPLVVALPDENAGLNVNTAKLALLRSVGNAKTNTPLEEDDGKRLQELVPAAPPEASDNNEDNVEPAVNADIEDGFEDVQEFLESDAIESIFGIEAEELPMTAQLTTFSRYFILSTEIEIGGIKRRAYSLLKRGASPSEPSLVIRRGTTSAL